MPLLLKGVPCIRYKDISVAYFLDKTGMMMPYLISEGDFCSSYLKEVPLHNHTTVSGVHQAMIDYLMARHPRKTSFTNEEVMEAMKHALGQLKSNATEKIKNQGEKLNRANSYLLGKLEERQEKESLIEKKSLLPVRFLFLLTVIQGAFLFYVTYYLYGWDVGEPISYLIALGIETLGMFFFLRKMGSLTPKLFFQRRQERLRRRLMSTTSTHNEIELKYAKTSLSRLRTYVKTLASL